MFKRLAMFSFLFTAAAFAQQQPQFGEKINVNLVLIDAVVTDSRGNQILGLDKDDFLITENGTPQTVQSVDYFTNRQLLSSPESKAPFKAERVRDDRYFVFFFDKPTGAAFFDRLALARRAATEFVDKQMKPGDRVAIVAHDVRLKIYSDFTSDPKQLKRALQDAASFGRGLDRAGAAPSGPSILRSIDQSSLINNTGTVYEALEVLGDALRPIQARKDVILFSIGIIEPGEEVRGGMVLNTSRFYDPMVGALNRADVSVYPINMLQVPEQPQFVHQTLSRIASDTNGQYFQFNTSFVPALRRIETMTNGYYLISYAARKPAGEHGFQKVNVAVKNAGFRVRARQGYAFGD